MTNNEAMIILEDKRSVANAAIHSLTQYINELENWKSEVAEAKVAKIKEDALLVGADLATWDGSSAD